MNKNVQIISIEAKDVISNKCAIIDGTSKKNVDLLRENGCRILRKYKGSLDYSLLSIHLEEMNKKIIRLNKNTKRYYSNDIITVKFNYGIDNSIILEDEKDEQYNSMLIVLDVLKSEKNNINKDKNGIVGKIERLHNNIPKNKYDLINLKLGLEIEQDKQLLLDEEDIDEIKLSRNEIKKFNNKINTVERKISEQPTKTTELEKELIEIDIKLLDVKEKINDIKERITSIENKYKLNTNELRNSLYAKGFNMLVNYVDTHYCRFMRSSGSARTGKINFINAKYYDKIIKWCMGGIKYLDNDKLDLPSLESYISLVTSSIISTFSLKAENILLIEEGTSTFTDTVMATELINEVLDEDGNIIDGDLHTSVQKKSITNTLFDGEACLSKDIFIENGYEDKAILQIRNKFYKGLGVNTDIQGFFKENSITEVSQLNGQTSATDIKQIKLICTKSSIKFLKYGTFEEWKEIMLEEWAICKYEKDQHNFNEMVNTHYQLINTLGLDFNSTKDLAQETLDYIKLLKNDVSVFKLHLGIIKDGGLEDIDINEKLSEEETEEIESLKTNSDMVLSMLRINEDFINTPLCRNFRYEVVQNYIKNVDKGHVLVVGTYATVVNSMYEYLLCSIGKWDGISSTIGKGQCVTAKFEPLEDVLGVRSPMPTMSNMTVFQNQESGILKDYFQTDSKNVIFISSIGWNVQELESSMDFDADAMLITNQKIITSHCKAQENDMVTVNGQTIKRFLVSTDFTPKTKINRGYNAEDLSDTDIKCAEGRLGECINLVQMLNSVYFTKKSKGATEEELLKLFTDISSMNILSCIIIDSCKKLSPVNVDREMNKIRAKNYLGKGFIIRGGKKKEVNIRPKFFKYLDGGKDYKFEWFECGMDYLVKIMSDKELNPRKDRDSKSGQVTLRSLLMKTKAKDSDRKKIQSIREKTTQMQIEISAICKDKIITGKEKFAQINDVRQLALIEIAKIEITTEMIHTIIKRLSDAYSTEDKFQEYKKVGRNILKVLYSIDSVKLLSCMKIKSNISGTLARDEEGKVEIFGVKFKEIKKPSETICK
ncbi:MAG: hypothetical protein ACI8WT_001796 [Clostridium sp.]|jgi:hypothetical protein